MSDVMSAIIGMMILCAIFGIIALLSLMLALHLMYKDIDIDDVTMEDEQ